MKQKLSPSQLSPSELQEYVISRYKLQLVEQRAIVGNAIKDFFGFSECIILYNEHLNNWDQDKHYVETMNWLNEQPIEKIKPGDKGQHLSAIINGKHCTVWCTWNVPVHKTIFAELIDPYADMRPFYKGLNAEGGQIVMNFFNVLPPNATIRKVVPDEIVARYRTRYYAALEKAKTNPYTILDEGKGLKDDLESLLKELKIKKPGK